MCLIPSVGTCLDILLLLFSLPLWKSQHVICKISVFLKFVDCLLKPVVLSSRWACTWNEHVFCSCWVWCCLREELMPLITVTDFVFLLLNWSVLGVIWTSCVLKFFIGFIHILACCWIDPFISRKCPYLSLPSFLVLKQGLGVPILLTVKNMSITSGWPLVSVFPVSGSPLIWVSL